MFRICSFMSLIIFRTKRGRLNSTKEFLGHKVIMGPFKACKVNTTRQGTIDSDTYTLQKLRFIQDSKKLEI